MSDQPPEKKQDDKDVTEDMRDIRPSGPENIRIEGQYGEHDGLHRI